jgi:hypothetical protein
MDRRDNLRIRSEMRGSASEFLVGFLIGLIVFALFEPACVNTANQLSLNSTNITNVSNTSIITNNSSYQIVLFPNGTIVINYNK